MPGAGQTRTVTPRWRGLFGSFESCGHGTFGRAGIDVEMFWGSFGSDLGFIEVAVREELGRRDAATLMA